MTNDFMNICKLNAVTKQRDELLAALKQIARMSPEWNATAPVEVARAVIAKAEGKD